MARGTSSNSGPAPDPNSLRGAKRGSITLPSEGYDGDIPENPLSAVGELARREGEWWAWAWRTPQAAAWIKESWRWVHVANWCRAQTISEGEETTAAERTALLRLAEEIGLTTSGLARNGWVIAKDQVSEKREESAAPKANTRGRLSAVRDAASS
jgi:hypothetical protein